MNMRIPSKIRLAGIACLWVFVVTLPVIGQETSLLRAVWHNGTILRLPIHFEYPIAQLSRQALSFHGTLAAQVASTHLPGPHDFASFEIRINSTWPARAVHAQIWQHPHLTVQEATQILVGEKPFDELSSVQQEDFFLADYPALVLEGPFGIQNDQHTAALDYYRKVLIQTSPDEGLNAWAKNMAAVSDIGLLGSPEDASLLLENAQKTTPEDLQPWTDVITARALLNLRAPEALQTLASFRLQQASTEPAPKQLPAVWNDLAQFASLRIHTHLIEKNTYPTMPLELQKALVEHNPYNLFHISAGPEITQNWKLLRDNLKKKKSLLNVEQDRKTIRAMIHQKFNFHRQPYVFSHMVSQRPASGSNPFIKVAPAYSNPAIWDTKQQKGKQRLLSRALENKQTAWQDLQEKQQELDQLFAKSVRYEEGKYQPLFAKIALLQEQYETAVTQFNQVQKYIEDQVPVDRISYQVYGYPLAHASSWKYTTNLHLVDGTVQKGLLSFPPAPAQSEEDHALKQALLNRAEQEFLLIQESQGPAFADSQKAANRWQYIFQEIQAGTPYSTIMDNAYTHSFESLPPIPVRFAGRGEYPSFEALAATQEEGYAKQELLNYVQHHYFTLRQTIYIDKQEIKLLDNNLRLFGRKKQNARRKALQDHLWQASWDLGQADYNLRTARKALMQNQPIDQIITTLYGAPAAQPNKHFWFKDATLPKGGFYAPVSSAVDGWTKQYFLDQILSQPRPNSYVLEEVRWNIQRGNSLRNIRHTYYRID
ncbi:MAG: hypothetical protein IKP06_03890 [Elusimicrobiaceae bacterium]|nr:hypothetical protein [Elusimicrobiaceae bacterium]